MTPPHLLTIDFELTGYEDTELAQQFCDNTLQFLQHLKDLQSLATFFCVGDVLEKFPDLIQTIVEQGHEIACHGWRHIPLDKLSSDQLEADLNCFLECAEKLQLGTIYGYRAPFFSLTKETAWAKDIIHRCGFLYDSSILPITTLLYGDSECSREPHIMDNGLLEIPVTVWQPLSVLGVKFGIPIFGGTYLRLNPLFVVKGLLHFFEKQEKLLMSYCHPYDMDSTLSNISAFENNPFYNFLLGLGRNTMPAKISTLIKGKQAQTIHSWIEKNREVFQ